MNKEQLAKAIVKAIAYTENGGAPKIGGLKKGKTGEMKSVFQFTPATWKQYSKEILGKEEKIHPDTETYVVNEKVKKWLDAGYKPEQIASMWNAGPGEPNAYGGKFSNGQASSGVNAKYGVKFDVPGYAKKFNSHFAKFAEEESKNPNAMAESTPQTSQPMPGSQQSQQVPGQMAKIPMGANPGQEIFDKVMSVLKNPGQQQSQEETPGQQPEQSQAGLLQRAMEKKVKTS